MRYAVNHYYPWHRSTVHAEWCWCAIKWSDFNSACGRWEWFDTLKAAIEAVRLHRNATQQLRSCGWCKPF